MLVAIDQGTTNTKALLIDRSGATVYQTAVPTALRVSANGEIGHDLNSLWQSTLEVSQRCAAWARANDGTIDGLCLTNQRETAAAWDRETGTPLAEAISWQCRRSSGICDRLSQYAAKIQESGGVPLDPLLTATKWTWMLEREDQVQRAAERGTLALGTVDAWLLFRLTGGLVHATDTTNASRTGLLNLDRLEWDASLLSLFGIEAVWLPKVMPSAANFGTFALDGFGVSMPIVAVSGDSHAALLGHGEFGMGTVKATYGTGSSLMALVPSAASQHTKLARTVAWTLRARDLCSGTRYALEGNITMSGAALQWVGEFLGLEDPGAAAARLAMQVPDSDGLTFVPAMAGLGAPHWSSSARGLITGLRPHHRAAHLARAALDAISMQVADVFEEMELESSTQFGSLRADGGATRNSFLMQLQADALAVPVYRSSQEELSALGVARLGGLTLGWWTDLELAAPLLRPVDLFMPSKDASERQSIRAAWQVALRRTLFEEAVR